MSSVSSICHIFNYRYKKKIVCLQIITCTEHQKGFDQNTEK